MSKLSTTRCTTFAFLTLLSAACLAGPPKFTVVHVDTRHEHLQLFLRDETGAPFHRFEKLDGWLASQGKQLTFAMNAGMFEPDYSPVGLFVAGARELAPLNLSSGRGNFFMKPNGVFFLTAAGPRIVESSKYSARPADVLLATQSGPLLVERGAIHPAFSATSRSRVIRNGVGVTGNTAVFVISDDPVTFYELAAYFRDQLKCDDALYLDGVVSALFLPTQGRRDSTVDLGPIVGVVQ
jgi:uncharacterized protein YigE (DUF2233 family)